MFDAKRDNSGCGFEEMVVSYIYEELSADDRNRFEAHTDSCGSCREESLALAGVSNRVAEWKETEFDPSVLPNVATAIAELRNEENEKQSVGGFSLAGIFGGWQISMAGGLALILFVAAFAWLFISGMDSNSELVENENSNDKVVIKDSGSESDSEDSSDETPVLAEASDKTETIEPSIEPSLVEKIEDPAPRPVRVSKTSPVRKVTKRRVVKKKTKQIKPVVKPTEVKPSIDRLTPLMAESEENSEDGLRLTDLFADEDEDES